MTTIATIRGIDMSTENDRLFFTEISVEVDRKYPPDQKEMRYSLKRVVNAFLKIETPHDIIRDIMDHVPSFENIQEVKGGGSTD